MERLLVGYDGSPASRNALAQACKLAKALNGAITLITAAADRLVREDGRVTLALDEGHGVEIAEQGAAAARECGIAEVNVITSLESPDDAIVSTAKQGDYTLVVVGHRSHTALEEFFLGSTAKHVVDRLECSVLVVRG